MKNELTKKYGLFTAISMVVGIVIGSGVFFKAQDILNYTQGNMPLGILAWLIGGFIMIVCSYTFATMATKYERVNGVVDYAETACGTRYAYFVGWFMATIYYPTLTSVLAWASARFTCVFFGIDNPLGSTECIMIAAFYLIASYAINALSPKIAGHFQVSTTIIKLIPLGLMAIGGTVVGLIKGTTIQSFQTVATSNSGSLFAAVVATAFAYEGWIVATSINAELRNAKKNLPLALTLGTLIVVVVYISYYVGVAGGATVDVLRKMGATVAFTNVFGAVGGTVLNAFIIISCLGTLNGLMLGCTRGMYSIAIRNRGPKHEIFKQVDQKTNMATNSAVIGLVLSILWLVFWYGGMVRQMFNNQISWVGNFVFDSSELPIITIYALYIPIFISIMIKEKSLNTFKRFVMPSLSLIGACFMVFAACYAHKISVVYYLVIFFVIMLVGAAFSKEKKAQ